MCVANKKWNDNWFNFHGCLDKSVWNIMNFKINDYKKFWCVNNDQIVLNFKNCYQRLPIKNEIVDCLMFNATSMAVLAILVQMS